MSQVAAERGIQPVPASKPLIHSEFLASLRPLPGLPASTPCMETLTEKGRYIDRRLEGGIWTDVEIVLMACKKCGVVISSCKGQLLNTYRLPIAR